MGYSILMSVYYLGSFTKMEWWYMRLLCSLFISNNIVPGLYSLADFSFSLVLSWCFCSFLLYSFDILLFRWSVGVCGAPATLATASKEEDSDNARISTTQNLNHASSQFWGEGEVGRGDITTIWRRIHSGNNHFHSNQLWEFGVYRCIWVSL